MTAPSTDASVPVPQPNGRASAALNRTCEGCRRRKIKCIYPSSGHETDTGRCGRCTKLSLDCVFLPPAIKKTRRRNETRIRDLERKLEAMQDAAKKKSMEPSPSDRPSSQDNSPVHHEPSWQLSSSTRSSLEDPPRQLDDSGIFDPITKGLVGQDLASHLYWVFCNNLAPLYPVVLPPEATHWQDVRVHRPALFQAAITAAAGSVEPTLSEQLFRHSEKMIAEKVVLDGEKSLDLAQALLVLSTWHHAPKRFQSLKFSQFANMASTMVQDLFSLKDERYNLPDPSRLLDSSSQILEPCRTFAACYLLSSGVAFSLRRQPSHPYGPWLRCYTEIVNATKSPHPIDECLASWVKLQKIAEEGLTGLGLNQGSQAVIDFDDFRTRCLHRSAIERVHSWRNEVPKHIMSGPLEMHYQMILTTFNEPALYHDHSPDDFRPPYTIRVLPQIQDTAVTKISLQAENMLFDCINSAKAILSAFLELDIACLQSVPVITFTRVAYSVVVLIKCYATLRRKSGFGSTYSFELTPTKILEPFLTKLSLAAGESKLQIPSVFHYAMSNVAKWCALNLEQQKEHTDDHNDLIEPMMHLGIDGPEKLRGVTMSSTMAQNKSHQYKVSSSQGPDILPITVSAWDSSNISDHQWMSILGNTPAFDNFGNAFDFNFDHLV